MLQPQDELPSVEEHVNLRELEESSQM